MRIVILAAGSAGDVHPFIAVGRDLRARGHEVAIYASAWFEEVVTEAGLRFEPVQSRERYAELASRPELWHPRKAFPFIMREAVLPEVRPLFEGLVGEARGGGTVLVASTLDLAGRFVHERHGVPLVTAHLAPAVFRTVHRMPVFKGVDIPARAPRWLKRGFWRLADLLFDPKWVPELNALRAELGLPPVRRPLNGWWNSPDRIIGLWPEWFGPPQPDWPPQLRLTGFACFDRADARPLDGDLARWLDRGSPPIVFTHGSANVQAAPFFRASLDACRLLGARGLLVTSRRDDVPPGLPSDVRHAEYVPFSLLLPHARALVSHGGIGTVAQGLRAGIPQVAVPMAHDQHDNGSRLEDLGVGRSIDAGRYRASRAAAALGEILDDPAVLEASRACASLARRADGASAAADAILAVSRERGP